MKRTTNISHPLKNRSGLSQKNRLKQALNSDYAQIDGKTLADRLLLINEYARHVNFYKTNGSSQEIKNWIPFFKESLPFQLAALSKTSVDDLEAQFLLLNNELTNNPSKQALEASFDFIYNKLIMSTSALFNTVEKAQNSFSIPLLGTIKSSFVEPLKSFICLYNASVIFLCIAKKDFSGFMTSPWQLKVMDIYAIDVCIKQVKKGKKQAFLKAAEVLNTVFYQMLSGFRDIVETAEDFIEESLYPLEESLQKKHQPHLALLFTFLELFKHFQGNINELGKKHMDFFYEQVLKMIPKDAVPDMAHIVFEVAKHLDEYPLHKDLLLKNGKDVNKQDIQFGLDNEIILDKAQVKELRTLSLYPVKDNDDKEYIEGVYIAPIANSSDGKGEELKKDQSPNWKTLGSKFSKLIQEGNDVGDEHPKARLGFVLASPVLLLQEGKRTIKILLNCEIVGGDPFVITNIKDKLTEKSQINYTINDNFLDECASGLSVKAKNFIAQLLVKKSPYEFNDLNEFLNAKDPINCENIYDDTDIMIVRNCVQSSLPVKVPLFNVWFSGEKEWIEAIPTIIINEAPFVNLPSTGQIQFQLDIVLDPEVAAVTFYNQEALKEKIDLKEPFPLVKIELNENVEIICPAGENKNEECCLSKAKLETPNIAISPYHFLQKLKLVDAFIDVTVCGVKNLIVQNDDNLQDVNKPIYPFGPRPKVGENWFVEGGANFYIGNKEIFCKNWKKFWINTTWKDKPANLEEHYKFYKDPNFEDGSSEINNDSFRFGTSILEDGTWKDLTIKPPPVIVPPPRELLKLFESHDSLSDPCNKIADQATFCHGIEKNFTPANYYEPKSMPVEPLEPLTVNTRKGFIRLTLAGVSFQHDRFTYVLTRQMMALADLVDPQSIAESLAELEATKKLAAKANQIVDNILVEIQSVIDTMDELRNQIGSNLLIGSIRNLALSTRTNINNAKANLPGSPGPAENNLDTALISLNSLITNLGNLGDSVNQTTVHGRINKVLSIANNIKDEITKEPIPPFIIFPPYNPNNIHGLLIDTFLDDMGLKQIMVNISSKIDVVLDKFDTTTDMGLPKEPYTPVIKSLSIDYHAIAVKNDIDIIHLYPYENTSKFEDIQQNPTLFPFFDNEGTLFIGIENITPGGTLSILFQLAEATADSEQDRAKTNWHYLSNNKWIELQPDFDVISDETDGFTVSGIVTIVVPKAINKIGNTIMPDNLYWIKASAPENVMALAETIGVHTQAAKASARLSLLSDKNRLDKPIEAGSISKLVEADFSVKKVDQIYPSFGGRSPEASGHFYVRVSEHLKHKGRGITISDYEKIVLEGFPEIYKVKCISHTMGLSANDYRRDLEVAPGYSVVAVIPDLTKLKSGNLQEPKAPVSLLEKIANFLREKTSPFARIKVMNPRYEYVDVEITVGLYRGKSPSFYAKKLKEDIALFLAPWFLGDSEKIVFGQVLYFSDVVGYVEQLDYVDFIEYIKLEGACNQTGAVIKPLTARSVLTGGNICVTIVKEECADCDQETHPIPKPNPELVNF